MSVGAIAVANLLYVVGALGVATLVSAAYVFRHRRPKSMESAIESFNRELRALAPDGPIRTATASRPAAAAAPEPTSEPIGGKAG